MNQDEFQSIVEQHTDLVYNVAYRMMSNAQDAEDITQETFLSAYRTGPLSGVDHRLARGSIVSPLMPV